MIKCLCILYFISLLNLSSVKGISSNELSDVEPTNSPETSFKSLGLDLHNELRQKHGVPPLKLNETLSTAAQGYANYLIRTNSFKNQLQPGYVKNLYQYKGTIGIEPLEAMKHAVEKWYATVGDYNWNEPSVTPFSAMIWKSSTDVGFGLSQRNRRTVIVAAYSPEGNLLGDDGEHFKENVLRSLSSLN